MGSSIKHDSYLIKELSSESHCNKNIYNPKHIIQLFCNDDIIKIQTRKTLTATSFSGVTPALH